MPNNRANPFDLKTYFIRATDLNPGPAQTQYLLPVVSLLAKVRGSNLWNGHANSCPEGLELGRRKFLSRSSAFGLVFIFLLRGRFVAPSWFTFASLVAHVSRTILRVN
jgi:hypothetical protein